VFHIEDDWVFFRKDSFLTKTITILEETPGICQVLINPNYTEVLYHPVCGGIPQTTRSGLSYLEHEHAVPETPEYKRLIEARYKDKANCVYWPHFSFRPSTVDASVYRELGAFDTEVGFFEFEYAKRYHYEKEYRSAFLPEVSCIHIGRLTSERFDPSIENAYTLNETSQFVKDIDWSDYEIIRDKDSFGDDLLQVPSNDLSVIKKACDEIGISDGFNNMGFVKKTIVEDDFLIDVSGIVLYKKKKFTNFYCINLERRPDRKDNMTRLFKTHELFVHFVRAVDGLALTFTRKLYELFRDNDFAYRKGFIGVALTHRNLWMQLSDDHRFDYYVILEDDIEITHPGFASEIERLSETPDWECIALGYHSFQNGQVYGSDPVRLVPMPREDNAGSIFGYMLHKRGAEKLLKYIEQNRIRHGIDYCVNKSDVRIDLTVPCMVKSPWVRDSTQDSDIQLNHECFSIQDFLEDQFEFYPNLDSKDDDLYHVPNKRLEEMMEIAKKDPRIRAFNTLGFFKTRVHLLEPSPYYSSPKDGIYIKKQKDGQKNEDSDRLLVYVIGDEIPDNPRLCDFLQQINVSNLVLCGTFQDIVSLRKYFRDRPFTIVSEVGQYTSDPSSYDRVLILPIDVFSYSEPGSETKHLEKIRLESKKLLQL
jgi:GR25 family glycosyltransferase involved in LPS biosynthesis